MIGKILGFDVETNTGTISGDDGKRYTFAKEGWKESHAPARDCKIDFHVDEEGQAIDIYQVKDAAVENNATVMGLFSLAITFFFGFLGTLVSRLVISKQSAGAALVPTAIHFVITLSIIIPVLGWIVYLIGTIYYMVKNYKLAVNPPVPALKYA